MDTLKNCYRISIMRAVLGFARAHGHPELRPFE